MVVANDRSATEVQRVNEQLEQRHYEFRSNCNDGDGALRPLALFAPARSYALVRTHHMCDSQWDFLSPGDASACHSWGEWLAVVDKNYAGAGADAPAGALETSLMCGR